MQLSTIQIAKHRLLTGRSIELIDTTVKSGNHIFAPTWEMVLGHKSKEISDERYTRMYRARMIQSMNQYRDQWIAFVNDDEPKAIACYCQAGKFCHRHLLIDIFREVCKRRGLPFHYHGEIT